MNHELNDIIESLIVRSLTGEATAEEQKQLAAWTALSESNARLYLSLKKALALTQDYYAQQTDRLPMIDVDKEWKQLLDRINERREPEQPSQKAQISIPMVKRTPMWIRMAATILLLVAAGVIINYFLFNSDVYYQTTNNTLNIALADGSTVVLNRNSELTYSSRFGSNIRSAKLKGEAFFEISKNPEKPFIIQAGDARVEVVGTSFSVSNYKGGKDIEVVVATGVVKLSAQGTADNLKLVPGEKGVYHANTHELVSFANRDINFLSWKTRKLVFIANDLRTVIETINKTYGVNITITSDVPPSCVVTVSFENQSLNALLNVLRETLNLSYRIQGDQIEITHAGC